MKIPVNYTVRWLRPMTFLTCDTSCFACMQGRNGISPCQYTLCMLKKRDWADGPKLGEPWTHERVREIAEGLKAVERLNSRLEEQDPDDETLADVIHGLTTRRDEAVEMTQ